LEIFVRATQLSIARWQNERGRHTVMGWISIFFLPIVVDDEQTRWVARNENRRAL
jgi:hypothetical protein